MNMCDFCYLPVVDAPMIPLDDMLYKTRAHVVVLFEQVCYVTFVYALVSVRDESHFRLPSSSMHIRITKYVHYRSCSSVLQSSREQCTLVYYLQ